MSRLLSLPMAALLTMAIAGQSFAAGWSSKTVVDDQGFVDVSGIATFANGAAIAVIDKCVEIGGGMCTGIVVIRRSIDSGITWGPRMLIAGNVARSGGADMAALAGRGNRVDICWRGDGLLYRRSRDFGETFGRARYVTHEETVREPDIARGPDGLVAISWGEWPDFTDQISVRVSGDGGRTFGAKHSWPTSDTDNSSVAVGDGVVYVAYMNAAGTPVLRRSLDTGETWSAAVRLGGMHGYVQAVTAEASDAYVAWVSDDGDGPSAAKYRRTTDRGESWSPTAFLSPPGSGAYATFVSLQDGVVRALYGSEDGMFYRQSADGIAWTSPERVSGQLRGFVGQAGARVVVLYTGSDYSKVFSRTRPV